MEFGITKGWTVIDCSDAPSLCAVSVKTAVRVGERPLVLAAAETSRGNSETDVDAMRELVPQMDRGLPMLVTLPRSQYRLRVMPEPAVPLREMPSSLRWALSTEAENPLDEFELAWMHIPTEELLPSRPKQVYAVMADKASMATRVSQWRQAGVRPKVVDIRETALRNLCGALERPGEGLALISADAGGVGMVFTHQGSLYLDRYIEQPLAELRGVDPTGRARLHERIALQLLRSVDVVSRNFPFMPVARVVVAPAPEELGLLEYLASQLPLKVEPLELKRLFDLSKTPALSQSTALQARCLVALGATLRSAKGAAS